MSTSTAKTETSAQPPALRLAACPQCDYALDGLPEEGICPECGRRYDQSVLIVRCLGPAQRINAYGLATLTLGLIAVAVVVALRFPLLARSQAPLMVMLAFFLAMAGLAWIDQVTSPRGGAWLVWVARQGIGLQTDFDPSSLLATVRRWLMVLWLPVYMLAFAIPMMTSSHWFAAVAFGGTFAMAMFIAERRMRPRFAAPADGVRPALIDWSSIARIELSPRRENLYRLRARSRSAWRKPLIDLTFEADERCARQVKERIEQLSGCVIV